MGNPIIIKIAKILAKAEDQAGTPEGELASKLATKMMREHAISMAEVGGVNLESDPLIEDTIEVGRVTWRAKLAWALARHCNCKAIRFTIRKNQKWIPGKGYVPSGSQTAIIRLYGHKTDVEVCQYLYEVCERQIKKAVRDWKRTRKAQLGGGRIPYSEGQAYRESMIVGLESKLYEIRKAGQKQDSKGTALVLRRAERAQEFMESRVEKIGTYKKSTKGGFNYDAFEKGKQMRLHKGVKDKSVKAIE